MDAGDLRDGCVGGRDSARSAGRRVDCGRCCCFATLVQGIVFRYGPTWQLERPRVAALLAYATLVCAVYGGLRWLLRRGKQNLQPVLRLVGARRVAGGGRVVGRDLSTTSATALAVHLAWLAGVWLVLAALAGWPALLTASQVAVVLAIFCGRDGGGRNARVVRGGAASVARSVVLGGAGRCAGRVLFGDGLGALAVGGGVAKPQAAWHAVASGCDAVAAVDRVLEVGLVVLLAVWRLMRRCPARRRSLSRCRRPAAVVRRCAS